MSKIFEALRKTENPMVRLAGLDDQLSQSTSPEESSQTAKPKAGQPEEATDSFNVQSVTIQLAADSPILPFDGTDPRASAQYRLVRTKIHQDPRQPKILVVTSPMPGDGKTISAINLASALALQENVRVALIDADFNRPSVANLLGIRCTPGLGELLHGNVALREALLYLEQLPNLHVLPAGKAASNSAELLASKRWQALCEMFRTQFRYTVLDGPPVGTIADYELLQLSADGVVLVIRPDHTDRRLCEMAFQTIPPAKQIGVILNCAEEWFLSKTQGYYYYGGSDRSVAGLRD